MTQGGIQAASAETISVRQGGIGRADARDVRVRWAASGSPAPTASPSRWAGSAPRWPGRSTVSRGGVNAVIAREARVEQSLVQTVIGATSTSSSRPTCCSSSRAGQRQRPRGARLARRRSPSGRRSACWSRSFAAAAEQGPGAPAVGSQALGVYSPIGPAAGRRAPGPHPAPGELQQERFRVIDPSARVHPSADSSPTSTSAPGTDDLASRPGPRRAPGSAPSASSAATSSSTPAWRSATGSRSRTARSSTTA